jgi:hypothetical protein
MEYFVCLLPQLRNVRAPQIRAADVPDRQFNSTAEIRAFAFDLLNSRLCLGDVFRLDQADRPVI